MMKQAENASSILAATSSKVKFAAARLINADLSTERSCSKLWPSEWCPSREHLLFALCADLCCLEVFSPLFLLR